MTNLPLLVADCSRQREKLIEAAVSGRERNRERNKILGADFVTRSNYFVTSDRRSGARRPLVYHYEMLLAAADFDSIVRQHRLRYPTVLRPGGGREGRTKVSRCVPRHSPSIGLIAVFGWIEPRRFVSASTSVLHPFCKLTVIRPPQCPAASIDRHSPIRHRNVGESRCFLHRARCKNSNCGITPIHGHALCAIAASTARDESRKNRFPTRYHIVHVMADCKCVWMGYVSLVSHRRDHSCYLLSDRLLYISRY